MTLLAEWAATLSLGDLLVLLRERVGPYELVAHREQGEFHHDVVVELGAKCIDFRFLVVATNCNGGVKEGWKKLGRGGGS